MFSSNNKQKTRNILTFHGNSFFSLKNCINYPVSSVSWRIIILSKKDHLYFSSGKRNICSFTKKVSFHRKSSFFDDFFLISLFSSNNKEKTLNIATIYFFSEKIINVVFFNVFRCINFILKKTYFTSIIHAIWIKKKILPKKWLFQSFLIFSFVGGRKPKKYICYLDNIIFSLKLHKIPIFMLLSLFYDNIFIFL